MQLRMDLFPLDWYFFFFFFFNYMCKTLQEAIQVRQECSQRQEHMKLPYGKSVCVEREREECARVCVLIMSTLFAGMLFGRIDYYSHIFTAGMHNPFEYCSVGSRRVSLSKL